MSIPWSPSDDQDASVNWSESDSLVHSSSFSRRLTIDRALAPARLVAAENGDTLRAGVT